MPRQKIGKIPEFTDEGIQEEGVKEPETLPEELEGLEEEVSGTEKDTPPESPPGEKPLGEEEVKEEAEEDTSPEPEVRPEDIEGLQRERERLLKEIQELRRERRELKQKPAVEQPITQEEVDELKDLHPEDVALIERILRAKGYVRKDELERELYEKIEQEEIEKFLEKHPEFKPENDPDDRNWNALQEELKWYRKPENPRDIGKLLEKARRAIQGTGERSNTTATKKRLEIASQGGSSSVAQRSSSYTPLDEKKIEMLRRGGWSEEEIQEILKKQR